MVNPASMYFLKISNSQQYFLAESRTSTLNLAMETTWLWNQLIQRLVNPLMCSMPTLLLDPPWGLGHGWFLVKSLADKAVQAMFDLRMVQLPASTS
jgi:hypothetical protein